MSEFDGNALVQRDRVVRRAFSPSAPIAKRDLFAGRAAQLFLVQDVVDEPGQHGVIFGERGVGKTSLASVLTEWQRADGLVSVRVNCTTNDTFDQLWRRAFNELHYNVTRMQPGFTGQVHTTSQPLGSMLPAGQDLTPDVVRMTLADITRAQPAVIFFDEFDRLADASIHSLFADTLKTLSDQTVPVTVVIVGVADNVDELVREHLSIERALVQVSMPRMSSPELSQIVISGLKSVDMSATQRAIDKITNLSQGLPHYTHLLAQQAASAAVWARVDVVDLDQVDKALHEAMKKAQESITDLYDRATHSNRDNLYQQVLLACAAARGDDRGFFAAASVREPLSRIMGVPYDIPQFQVHLNALSSERGPALKKHGKPKKYRYRFVNPLLQPYVIMRGLVDGLIDNATLDELQAAAPPPVTYL